MTFKAVAVAVLIIGTLCGCSAPTPSRPAQSEPSMQDLSRDPLPEILRDDATIKARLAGLPEPYRSAEFERGRALSAACPTCHSIDAGRAHALGPNLYGVFSRRAGAAPDFDYSDALKSADFQWSAEKLDQWLQSPDTFLPGNKMSYAGMARAEHRRDLIAYLMIVTAP